MTKSKANSYFLKGKKDKKTDEIAKLVLGKMRTQKSKEYMRKLKRTECVLPKLDMQGRNVEYANNIRYYMQSSEEKTPKNSEILPSIQVLEMKRHLRHRRDRLKPFSSIMLGEKNQV